MTRTLSEIGTERAENLRKMAAKQAAIGWSVPAVLNENANLIESLSWRVAELEGFVAEVLLLHPMPETGASECETCAALVRIGMTDVSAAGVSTGSEGRGC